ncbi:MAG: methylenetetrahydrofolate--tRNA-(uracil(54)-C(5))-methyltransferase (FADH(2)-oxidizing) TrmFO [Proteobacteria bacterium]|nr:methylenetetrahydrofolate--tRNA-(uracil(54)-C(5))-methyltransferase (FADH(2)-oxidizing) TrmFO [Pseudomonadota bacterium]
MHIHIVGGGLAGSEAAWQVLSAGFSVTLHEMRPTQTSPAHKTGRLAELVCSNSLKSMSATSAPGLLKAEMVAFGSLVMRAADAAKVPAGQALAVDREVFSKFIEDALASHANFTRLDHEVVALPTSSEMAARDEIWIVATGPLTSAPLAAELQRLTGGQDRLYFYDAIAPVIAADSIDLQHAFAASRYDRESDAESAGDYLNLPLNKAEYEAFIDALAAADYMPLHAFESTKYFESCLPVEVMVERGRETLRFGPMKPVGLINPKTGHRPWANVQLRLENTAGTMYSMVGFQTKMKWPEQQRVFALIPALRNAEFLRFGSVHRNTYLKSPEVLNPDLSVKGAPGLFVAGQITGVEGYTESAAIGLLAARAAVAKAQGLHFEMPPRDSMIGALVHYVTHGGLGDFQPMNANLGLLPHLERQRGESKADKKGRQCLAAHERFQRYAMEHRPGL